MSGGDTYTPWEGDAMSKQGYAAVTVDVRGTPGGSLVLSVRGRLSLDELSAFLSRMYGAVDDSSPSDITIDFAAVDYVDSAAALVMATFRRDMERRGLPQRLINVSDEARRILDLVELGGSEPSAAPLLRDQHIHPVEKVGRFAERMLKEVQALMVFIGGVIRALVHSLCHLRELRWADAAINMKRVGVQGLPIVTLISLLVGLIIAFMSSLQLKPLGGDVFVAALVGIAMVKELAPLMTAIIVAGRSGSAFAAEIGAMVVNEEVDALRIMGFEPLRFLVIPRMIAILAVVPLLTLYADFFGLLGGLVVGILGLDLTVITYVNQTGAAIALSDVATGLVKSVAFAAIIAGSGCYHGLRVKRGAEGVGRAATSAVVSAIFFIVLADSIFAVVLHYL